MSLGMRRREEAGASWAWGKEPPHTHSSVGARGQERVRRLWTSAPPRTRRWEGGLQRHGVSWAAGRLGSQLDSALSLSRSPS